MVDAFTLRDVANLGKRAEQWQSAVPDVIAASTVVNKPNGLVSELTVL